MEVILLGKIKIHEIAKKLNLNSKDVLDKAKELGINVKTHLSGIEESEAAKLEEAISNKSVKGVGAGNVRAKEEKAKPTNPVIIRREVINTDLNTEKEKKRNLM